MKPIKYIRGNKDKVDEIKKSFISFGAVNANAFDFNEKNIFYYLDGKYVCVIPDDSVLLQFIIENGEEIKLPEKKLPKTWEGWVKMYPEVNGEFYIDKHAHISITKDDLFRCWGDQNLLSSKEDAEGLLALIKLKRLRDCYNDGWKPDWEDDMQPKFCIDLDLNKTNCVTFWNSNSFLSFKNAELRDEFINNFKELIEKAKMWL